MQTADDTELRRAYEARSRYLKLLAWLNDAEHAALPPATRHERWAAFDAGHPNPQPPSTWTGFAVIPGSSHSGRATPTAHHNSAVPSQTPRDEWMSQILPG